MKKVKWIMDVMKANAKGKKSWLVDFFGKQLRKKMKGEVDEKKRIN